MRVLLINPPSLNEIIGNNPAIIETERGYNPPLGLLMVAAYIREHSSHQVEVIDAQVEELSYDNLLRRLERTEFDIVGLTAMTFTILDVIKTIKTIKKAQHQAKIVLGGPHVNIFPEETINLEGVDYVILGEGEVPFTDLLNSLEEHDSLENVQGLVFVNKHGNIVNTGNRGMIENLDTLPFPARDLTPYHKYSSLLGKYTPVTTMFTSRGCPFKCKFCDRPHLGKRFRAMSAERVIEEMKVCLQLGIHEFLIYDDTFTVDRNRVKKICELIIGEKLDVGFDIRARVDTLDEQTLKSLKHAGCRAIHYGVEAGTEKVLKVLNKGIHLDQAKKVFDLTREYGMKTLAYFMIGSPTEELVDIKETFRVSKWLKPDFIHMTILTPFPGTPLYVDALREGVIKRDYWREFARNPHPEFTPPFWEENFTAKELESLVIEGYKQFYCRPSNVIKNLFSVRSPGEFFRKAKAGIKVFFMKSHR